MTKVGFIKNWEILQENYRNEPLGFEVEIKKFSDFIDKLPNGNITLGFIGSFGSGKSTLAKMLGKKLDCKHLSVDDLRSAILPYIPKEQLREKCPFEFMYFNDNDAFFEKYTPQEMLKADIRDAETLWPGVKEFINHQFLCNEDFVLESVPLLPSLVNELKTHRMWDQVRVAYIVKTDVEKIRNGFEKNNPKSDWLLRNTTKKETLDKAAIMVSEYGKYFIGEAEKFGFRIFDTGEDFNNILERASIFLTD